MKKKNKILRAAAVSAVLAFGITFGGCAAGCGRFIGGQASPSSAGTESGSTAGNPSTPSGSGNQNDKIQLSSITYKLMTDDYYLGLARKIMKESRTLDKNMLPIPYQFLREEGKDVDAYLDGTLNAFASSYMYNDDKNHLYVSVKAENKSYSEYGNYYTNYVLKYPLTDQESEEYKYLCEDESLQGLLFIQELDIQKTPEVLSEVNIAKFSYEKVISRIPNGDKNPYKYNTMEVDFYETTLDDVRLLVRGPTLSNYSKSTIGDIKLDLTNSKPYSGPCFYDNNAYYYADPLSADYSIDDYLSSIKNITSFGYGQRIAYINPYQNDYNLQLY